MYKKSNFKFKYNDGNKKRAPRERIVGPGFQVKVIDNDVTKAWRKLKKLVMEDGMLEDVRRRQHFEKKSFTKHQELKTKRRQAKRNRIKGYVINNEYPNYSQKKLGKIVAKKGKNGLRALGLNAVFSVKK